MMCELSSFAYSTETHERLLATARWTLHGARGADASERDWIAATFGGSWPQEAEAGSNWFARDEQGRTCGFATYEQRQFRYWWLEGWLDKPDVGLFGPMGVSQETRGRGLGTVLTQRALQSLKELGFQRALIPAVGPVEFYERCCGARVIQRLECPPQRLS